MADSSGSIAEIAYDSNAALSSLPDHLKQFVVDQNYDQYTAVDHAVWRFIMRRNIAFLKEHAHQIYFNGLLNTGISPERIPRISEMNDILGRIGWGAVAVDGFIPPAAFMEFQAYRVLVIAADMRQIDHIEYTPAPDIVHEAAGHAPIIVDEEYADYLRHFGEIGSKAMSSKQDFELYQAIRHLSILKEAPDSDLVEVKEAEKQVEYWQENLGEPSEMAKLSRLHWWTVEYGLIGEIGSPRIYGAGLLSSIGEASSCLKPHVKKIPYSVDACNLPFDITTQQPQLFVTPDFQHLNDVLDEFASNMVFNRGGVEGLTVAINSENVATAVYSSGLQVSGRFSNVITDDSGALVYLSTEGATALACDSKQIELHGKSYHADGFGSPVGLMKNCPRPPENLDDSALSELGITKGEQGSLSFESGVEVRGVLEKVLRKDGKLLLLSFSNCSVRYRERTLFKPEWGMFDMAVGQSIDSVFSGASDKDAFEQIAHVPKERTVKITYDDESRRLHELYQQVRTIREDKTGHEKLGVIWDELQGSYPDDWLLSMEIFEIIESNTADQSLRDSVKQHLKAIGDRENKLNDMIEFGFHLVEKNLPV